jgi:hypothetical protein
MAGQSIPASILHDLEAIAPYVADDTEGEITSPATAEGAKAAGAAESAATAVPDFLSRLTSENLWIRVLKVVTGLVLIISGLVQLTHAEKLIGPAAKAAVLA